MGVVFDLNQVVSGLSYTCFVKYICCVVNNKNLINITIPRHVHEYIHMRMRQLEREGCIYK